MAALREISESLRALKQRKDEIFLPVRQFAELLKNYEKSDPLLSEEGRKLPSSEIRRWGVRLAGMREQLQSLGAECSVLAVPLDEQIKGLRSRDTEISSILSLRRDRLESARIKHHQELALADSLRSADGFPEFIRKYSAAVLGFLDQSKCKLSGWDEVFRRSGSLDQYGFRENQADQIASVKLLTALYGQLSREVGYPLHHDFKRGFVKTLKAAGIKRVLEIAPESRGIVNILAETGIASEAGISLHAIDLQLSPVTQKNRDKAALDIKYIEGDARELGKYLSDSPAFDLICSVGVLGLGGQESTGSCSIFDRYSDAIKNSHQIVRSSFEFLNPSNPHACFITASILGILCLEREVLEQEVNIAFWRKASSYFQDNEGKRILRPQPESRQEIRDYRDWQDEQTTGIDLFLKLRKQASDLTILKRDSRG